MKYALSHLYFLGKRFSFLFTGVLLLTFIFIFILSSYKDFEAADHFIFVFIFFIRISQIFHNFQKKAKWYRSPQEIMFETL